MAGGTNRWELAPAFSESTEADLGQDALTGQKLCAQTNYETEHGETAIPGFCEIYEAEA